MDILDPQLCAVSVLPDAGYQPFMKDRRKAR